jgi:septal ring factor EnvC (AmiA/AmiB activator)
MKIVIRNILLILLIFLTSISFSQSRKDLELRKKKKQQEIAYTNKLLNETRRNKNKSLNELVLLNNQISNRRQLINAINDQISEIDEKIDLNKSIIESMEDDLDKLKKEYAKLIYFAWKNKSSYDKIMFLLSSEDFNQAYKRMLYFKQYSEFRKKQVEAIKETEEILIRLIADLEKEKETKRNLIELQYEETKSLSYEKSAKSSIVLHLKEKESDLQNNLKKQRQESIKLQKEIARIIEEAAKKAAKNVKSGNYSLTPEEKLISDKFGANKGRLPWPTERGVITGTFGKHQHPVFKEVTTTNNGIIISTSAGSYARAIFGGTVLQVIHLSNSNTAVMVKHGEYITVYSHLKEAIVAKGEKITAKQKIGIIYTDNEDNKTTVELQIWKGSTKLNPSYWVSRK